MRAATQDKQKGYEVSGRNSPSYLLSGAQDYFLITAPYCVEAPNKLQDDFPSVRALHADFRCVIDIEGSATETGATAGNEKGLSS